MNQNLDQRIGMLSDGSYYAFVNGYDKAPVRGTLDKVQAALGITPETLRKNNGIRSYEVRAFAQFPAWDEVDGFLYSPVYAEDRAQAIKTVRAYLADDGHMGLGKIRFSVRQIS